MQVWINSQHTTIPRASNSRADWLDRSSLRVILSDGDQVGLGEAAPLPGYSPDHLAEVRSALSSFPWPESLPDDVQALRALVQTLPETLPSARFAAETSLFSLRQSQRGQPLWKLFTNEIPNSLPLAATLWHDDPRTLALAAREAATCGRRTLKLKVGKRSLDDEVSLLGIIRQVVGERVNLRLDANGAFSRDELPEALAAYARCNPEFIEEPSDLESMLSLERSKIPLALDESLIQGGVGASRAKVLKDVWRRPLISHLVLKPSTLGGLFSCRDIAREAAEHGRTTSLSHLLEGPIARAAIAHLALAMGGTAAGLTEHPALAALSDRVMASWIEYTRIEAPLAPGLGLEMAW